MKLNTYKLISNLLEARFNLLSAQKARQKIQDLRSEYQQAETAEERKEILWKLKQAQSNLTLIPNSEYDIYRDY